MHLQTLLVSLKHQSLPAHSDLLFDREQEITSIAYDSRKVRENGLFVAIAGAHTDGRRYLMDAASRGAVVAVGEALPEAKQKLPIPYIEVPNAQIALAELSCAFYEYPANHLCTIGITGLMGKLPQAISSVPSLKMPDDAMDS